MGECSSSKKTGQWSHLCVPRFVEFDVVFIRRRTRGYNYSLYESLRERCDVSVGLGVDIVEIERMRRILDRTPSFAHKVFTDAEQDYCNREGNPATHYAARFAAKEAVCKALGTGILASGIGMRDVEVVRDSRQTRHRVAWRCCPHRRRAGRC